MTRALVVGLGSIGERHRRLLRDGGHEVAAVSRHAPDAEHRSIHEAVATFAPDYVVVASETSRHAEDVRALAAAGFAGALLIEKPLAISAEVLDGAVFARVGVGFNLRFHPVLRRLRELLGDRRVLTVDAYAGQHLDSWRARPAREQYSAHRNAGGGVLRDLSHELDYLTWMLGPAIGVTARGGRFGDVTEDADDAWAVVAQLRDAPLVSLQLNYLDVPGRRRVIVTTETGTLEADLTRASLTVDDGAAEFFGGDRDAGYRDLHAAMLSGGADVATTAEGARVDTLILAIEVAAAEGRWVEVA